ncbi:ABC transporter ATP-binding protein [Ochrobactrum sp. AN78]|uniref:ABC transporter ATP-binding protein n=1 Tax=Ochrobactrum sp. AN78 TaxID=3039853 RepID=UPI0021F6B8E6|nr:MULTISPECIES: ABC transporter ATP-binding protein [Brucella/Ochrobactrum group]MCV9907865.1 ABC transporter ATP-binding protein [Brucella sp. HL-2]MDH7792120.1 putative spermidine/putrescine transport system ATP-binding protein [Ochrobactrum sp. AN78]
MNAETPQENPKMLIKGLGKEYGSVTALEPSNLTVNTGEFVTLLGPSGSGKTTLLQMISGLVEPTHGELWVDGKNYTHTAVNKRDMGLVFQHYALFPHMTVSENIAFPLKMRGTNSKEVSARVSETLAKVQLEKFASRFPRELSGGQQQRVALARCFVYRPQIILMDEPLGALDKNLREHMQFEIKRLHREFGTTVIYVTHDQEEALVLSDRICLMNHAKIEQLGTPRQIYSEPASVFAAKFIGMSNILGGKITEQLADHALVETQHGQFSVLNKHKLPVGSEAHIVLRPEQMKQGNNDNSKVSNISGTVSEVVYVGSDTRLLVTLKGGETIIVLHDGVSDMPSAGDPITYHWHNQQAVLVA